DGATLYATVEPCPMCAGAAVNARVARIVFGCADPKAGYCGTLGNIPRDDRLNHRPEVEGGLLAEESAGLLQQFFRAKRTPASCPGLALLIELDQVAAAVGEDRERDGARRRRLPRECDALLLQPVEFGGDLRNLEGRQRNALREHR